MFTKSSIKYKCLSIDELIINLDRLSRFKNPEESFSRVFSEIISKCLISPKFSKADFDKLDCKYISKIVEEIWNKSVENNYKSKKTSKTNLLKLLVDCSFRNLDERTKTFISAKLNVLPILQNLNYNESPFNLKFLIKTSNLDELSTSKLINNREKYLLKFPIKKLLIVEGITEEILLPVFADKLGLNLDKNGIYILGAGGKSKSPALYMKLKDKLKIPVILLFDADASEINEKLKKNLLKKDSTIIIDAGEFEDILSTNLIKRSLNAEYKPATPLSIADLRINNKMCDNIEYFYKSRHLGEFKKSKVSKIIAQNIKYKTDVTKEIKNILLNII